MNNRLRDLSSIVLIALIPVGLSFHADSRFSDHSPHTIYPIEVESVSFTLDC